MNLRMKIIHEPWDAQMCCREYVDHTFSHANFCMYDNNMLVKPVYLKVLQEGESKYRVVAFFFY